MNKVSHLFWILLFASSSIQAQIPESPATAKRPVSSDYHGLAVTEDYRWLENFDDPTVKEWIRVQNASSRAYLDALPSRREVADRLRQLLLNRSITYGDLSESGEKLFALKDDPKRNQKSLVYLRSPDDLNFERMILDPETLNPKGTTAIDWFVPSFDGKLVAVSLSEDGSEDGTVHVFRSETGEKLQDVIPRVQYPTGGGSLTWGKDAAGFYYTRYPHEGERAKEELNFYQQVFYHKLGTPSSGDTYVIGREFPRIAEIKLESGNDGKYLLVSVANGDGGEFAHWLMNDGKWTQFTKFNDGIVFVTLGKDDLYCISRKKAPHGEILKVPLSYPDLSARRLTVPSGESVIKEISLTSNKLYVTDLLGGPEQVRIFNLDGDPEGTISTKALASVGGIVSLSPDEVLYSVETYTEPTSFYRYNLKTGESSKTSLCATPTGDLKDIDVVREFAVSKDGTRIAMSIMRSKGTVLDGKNPVLLYGYGGYGISLTPSAHYWLPMWIEQGGVYVEVTLRGGGEYGEEWHRSGNLTNKQNAFDDFAASARWLIEHNYANPSQLAIMGASNGGLLMGAELTQHPELFRAVVSRVGIYDMLRSELSPNGAFNVTEFGTVTDPAQFKALYSYSPYHNVKDGTKYPAVLMATGDRDGRVDPMQSRKMVARLQAASNSGFPVLLRTTAHAGHGMGTSREEFLSEQTDIFVFLTDQLGMKFKPHVP